MQTKIKAYNLIHDYHRLCLLLHHAGPWEV